MLSILYLLFPTVQNGGESSNKGLSGGGIAGIVITCLVVVICIVLAIVFLSLGLIYWYSNR